MASSCFYYLYVWTVWLNIEERERASVVQARLQRVQSETSRPTPAPLSLYFLLKYMPFTLIHLEAQVREWFVFLAGFWSLLWYLFSFNQYLYIFSRLREVWLGKGKS
jgi:hypothetical protein